MCKQASGDTKEYNWTQETQEAEFPLVTSGALPGFVTVGKIVITKSLFCSLHIDKGDYNSRFILYFICITSFAQEVKFLVVFVCFCVFVFMFVSLLATLLQQIMNGLH